MPQGTAEPPTAASSWSSRLVLGLIVLVAGSLAFCLSLIVNAPASRLALYLSLPPLFNHISGTAWHGAATFAEGSSLQWHVDAKATIARRAVVAPITITGPDVDLRGSLVVGLRTAGIEGMHGVVGWGLVGALMPSSEIGCVLSARLIDLVAIGIPLRAGMTSIPQATGVIEVDAGSCSRADGQFGIVPVPALVVRIDPKDGGTLARITATDAMNVPLADAELTTDGQVIVTVHPEGARRVPGMPSTTPTTLEFPLSAILP